MEHTWHVGFLLFNFHRKLYFLNIVIFVIFVTNFTIWNIEIFISFVANGLILWYFVSPVIKSKIRYGNLKNYYFESKNPAFRVYPSTTMKIINFLIKK